RLRAADTSLYPPARAFMSLFKLFEHGAQRCRSLGIGGDECLADRHIARGLRLELVRQLTDDRIEFEHGADILRLKLRPADETVDLAHQTRPAQSCRHLARLRVVAQRAIDLLQAVLGRADRIAKA